MGRGFRNGHFGVYVLYGWPRDRFRLLRVSQESIGMVLCTGLFQYARWLTVHIFDFISLPITCRDVYEEMMKEFFTFAKSKKPFLALLSIKSMNRTTNH